MRRFNFAARNEKRGFSLAELTVVLAVVSIVALMVVSFATMVSARSAVSTAKLKMMEDRQLTRVVLESWLDRLTAADAEIQVDNGIIIAYLPGGEECTVLLEEEQITATVPDGAPFTFPVSTLTSLTFEHMENISGDIYFCTAGYQLPDPSGGTIQRTFTFTLKSHVGDVYGGVGA